MVKFHKINIIKFDYIFFYNNLIYIFILGIFSHDIYYNFDIKLFIS